MKQTMDTASKSEIKMGNTATATISPSNCELTQMTASKLNRSSPKGTKGTKGTKSNNNRTTADKATDRRKSHLYQSKSSSHHNLSHLHSRSSSHKVKPKFEKSNYNNDSSASCENDCNTTTSSSSSPLSSPTKKPLHLQIMEDDAGFACENGSKNKKNALNVRPLTVNHHVSLVKTKEKHSNISSSVPVTSDREERIQRSQISRANDNDEGGGAADGGGVIIHPSSSRLPNKTMMIMNGGAHTPFVPIGDEFKQEEECGGIMNASSDNESHSGGGSGGERAERGERGGKSCIHGKMNNIQKMNRHSQSESSTPDLASALPLPCTTSEVDCTPMNSTVDNENDSMHESVIINPPPSTALGRRKNAIRLVSTSGSDLNSEQLDGDKMPTTASLHSNNSNNTNDTESNPQPRLQTQQKINIQLKSGNVASALDQVLAELEENGMKPKKKTKPCILQQSLVGDSGSSTGTSTPNENLSESGGGSNTCNKDSKGKNQKNDDDGDDNSNSLLVQSSMLLPEDSLNVIAQMTISSGSKKEKKNVVTFQDDCQTKENTEMVESSTKTTSTKPYNNSSHENINLIKPLSEAIRMDIVHPIIPSPPNDIFTPQPVNEVSKDVKRPPLISGTASAQLKLIAGKSSNGISTHNSKEAKSQFPSEGNSIDVDNNNNDNNPQVDNGENGNVVWEKGMSMLADIISNATPMKMKGKKTLQSEMDEVENPSISNIAPVGQSLRLYASIAAQAGISSYNPAKTTTATAASASTSSNADPSVNELPQQQVLNAQPPEKELHDCGANHASIPEPTQLPEHYIREIGKIRRFDASIGAFGEWENLPFQTYGDSEPRRWCELNIDESIEIPLRRGGRLRVFPNFLGDTRRTSVKLAMDNCQHYRQYSVVEDEHQSQSLESRFQVLLSSQARDEENSHDKVGVGYMYKGVCMKAKPLSQEPQIEKLHNDLAELYRLPNKQWNIGANLLYYRDGNDHTTWHADDTQGEALILCIVVDSHSHTRPILVKPKTELGFRDGDEEIIIFVGQGDAYEMDGQMQMNYEHCLPKKNNDLMAKRSAIIFRHGNTVPVAVDTGIPLISDGSKEVILTQNDDLENNGNSSQFGHIGGEIREGKKLYSKDTLKKLGAHRYDKRIISGSIRDGCESILVESQNRSLREDDGLCWLQISCNKANGGGALCQSYHKKTCIRVFRSSELQNKFAPVLYEGEDHILYRYDGLYTVRAMWDSEGSETEQSPTNDEMHTFFLMRQPKRPADGDFEQRMNYNKISLQELWNEIQKRKGVRKPKDFAVPEPIMDVGRIGGSRRKVASSRRVLRNEEKNTKPAIKKKNVNVVPLQSYSNFSGNGGVFHHRAIYSSDSDSGDDSEDDSESIKSANVEVSTELYHDNGRPRRKSAAVARSYLKEVMHNRYGDVAHETPQKTNVIHTKKRSIWSADGKSENKIVTRGSNKRLRQDESSNSASDDSIGDYIEEGEKLLFPDHHDQPDQTVGEDKEVKIEEEEVLDKADDDSNSSHTSGNEEKTTNQSKVSDVSISVVDEKLDVHDIEQEVEEEINDVDESKKESKKKTEAVNPEGIIVGSRVNVEYRNTLFKATVRRTRVKEGVYEFSIHYDGNKKSNVHWIPSSMIHEVLDEKPVDVSPEVKPKRGRKKKGGKSSKPVQGTVEEVPSKIKVEEKEEEIYKFAVGSEVYANYKSVLYLSSVLKAKKNKKGNSEYLIHYDGFKKTADRWIKESAIFEVNDETTRRFNEQRGIENGNQSVEITNVAKKQEIEKQAENDVEILTVGTRSLTENQQIHQNTQPEPTQLDMGDIDSGVEFLPGSCVFVVKTNALYLAKMVKRRKKGRGKEYLVQFDGMSSKYNEWVSLSHIYELNPKTRKIYEKTADLRTLPKEDDDDDDDDDKDDYTSEEDTKKAKKVQKRQVSGGGKSTRAAPKENSTVNFAPKTSARISKRGGAKGTRAKKPQISQLYDMQNIEPGVEFLPGSTLFVQWKNGLYLGKMLKKRGRGEHMEYLIHYDGYKSTQDEWVSVSMVFEINPQTKRAFNKQKKT